MKRQYIPENPCVLSFSREKWVSFNTRQPDQKTGRMIEIKHPILFRIVSIYFFLPYSFFGRQQALRLIGWNGSIGI